MARKSESRYPADWPKIAERIKERAGWCCVRCGHPHDTASGYMLTVHHLDLNPQNCEWWNVPALCQRCHLSIQGRVILERGWMLEHSDWFKPYVAGYYAKTLGYRTDRRWVTRHIDDLLVEGQFATPPAGGVKGANDVES